MAAILDEGGGTVLDEGGSSLLDEAGGAPAGPFAYGGTVSADNGLGGSATVSPAPMSYGGSLTVTANTYAGTSTGNTMQEVDITLNAYNDMSVAFAVTSGGSEMNLTGYTVNMLLKPSRGVADNASGVLKLSSAGMSPAITVTNTSAGQCTVLIPNASITPGAFGFYRVDVVNSGSQQDTAIWGTVTIVAL